MTECRKRRWVLAGSHAIPGKGKHLINIQSDEYIPQKPSEETSGQRCSLDPTGHTEDAPNNRSTTVGVTLLCATIRKAKVPRPFKRQQQHGGRQTSVHHPKQPVWLNFNFLYFSWGILHRQSPPAEVVNWRSPRMIRAQNCASKYPRVSIGVLLSR